MLNKVDFNIIKQIQDKADIVAVISTFIKLNRKGNNYMGICPFHADRNPSLVVSPKKKIFKCFVCGAKGNVFGFVQQYKKVPFIEAVKIVAKLINFDDSKLEFSSSNTYLDPAIRRCIDANKQVNEWYKGFLFNPENKNCLDYLKSRGLDEKTIKYFEFGYAPKDRDLIYRMASNANQMFGVKDKELTWNEKELLDAGLITINQEGKIFDFLSNRITIPIYDNNGYLVAFSGRTIQNAEPKYLNTSTTKIFSKANTLFNFAKAKQDTTNKLIIVEGYMDAIAYYRAGFPNVVATMGVALSSEHLNALSTLTGLETIILSFDNDNAGQIATVNHGQKLMENGFNTYVVGPYDKSIKDIDELLSKNGKEAINKILDERIDYVTFLINSHFTKTLPLDETEEVVNNIIKTMLDLGDNSILLRSKHLKLLAEKSGLEYQDLLAKYERDLQKINIVLPNEKTFTKKPFKPTNTIGLDKTFIESDEQSKEQTKEKSSYWSSIIHNMKSQRALKLRGLTDAYDYLIKTLINNPTLLPKVEHDLTLNTFFEFEEQELILKSIRYLHEKQMQIDDKSLLEFLKNRGEKNPKYSKAHDYLFNQLNQPYYVNFSKSVFAKNGDNRLNTTKREIISLKKELLLYDKVIRINELNKNLSSENEQEIKKILLEIQMVKKIKN